MPVTEPPPASPRPAADDVAPGDLAAAAGGDEAAMPRLLGQARVLADLRVERRARPDLPPALAAGLAVPALVLLVLLVAWPAVRIAGEALDGGLTEAREQPGAGGLLGRTLLTAVVVPTVVTAAGLGVALATGRDRIARWTIAPIVAPVAVPLTVTAIAVRHLYGEGPLAESLPFVGVLAALAWAWVGLAAVVFRAALDRVEPELADATRAHGATGRALWRDAAWRPVLRRTALVVFAAVALASTRWTDLALVPETHGHQRDTATLGSLRWGAGGMREASGPAAGWSLVWLGLALVGVALVARRARRRWPPPLLLSPPPVDDPVERPVARRLGVAALAALWAIPPGALVLVSLRSDDGFGIDAYRDAFDGTALLSSMLLTFAMAAGVAVAVTALGLGLAAAWTWAPLPRLARAGGLVVGLALVALAVPGPVVAGAAGDVVGAVGLDGPWVRTGVVHVGLLLPVAVLVLRNSLAGTDLAALDHARRRGRPGRELLAERVPGAASAAVAVAVVAFVLVWGDLVVSRLFAAVQGTRPVGVLLHDLALNAHPDSALVAAAAVLCSLVPLAVVALARRPLLDGLTAGALR